MSPPTVEWSGEERRQELVELADVATEAAREAVAGLAEEVVRTRSLEVEEAFGRRLAAMEGRLLRTISEEVRRQMEERAGAAAPAPLHTTSFSPCSRCNDLLQLFSARIARAAAVVPLGYEWQVRRAEVERTSKAFEEHYREAHAQQKEVP